MRLVFLGTPDSVLAPLQTLVKSGPAAGHQVVGVVSQPARPIGRSRLPVDPPVAAWAKAQGLPVLQPEKAGDPEFLRAFAALAPDVAITAAYGQILPAAFLGIPRRATINIHPSLLPRYRGATPVPAALLGGETRTGVTVLFTVPKLDAGPIILQESLDIGANETTPELTDRAFAMGGKLVLMALDKLADADFHGQPQDEAQVSLCRKIDKRDGCLDWHLEPEDLYNRYRAFQPWPGVYTFLNDRRLVLTDMCLAPAVMSHLKAGEVVYDKQHRCLVVGAGGGALWIRKLQAAGGKEVPADAFWNGLKDRSHVVFGGEDRP